MCLMCVCGECECVCVAGYGSERNSRSPRTGNIIHTTTTTVHKVAGAQLRVATAVVEAQAVVVGRGQQQSDDSLASSPSPISLLPSCQHHRPVSSVCPKLSLSCCFQAVTALKQGAGSKAWRRGEGRGEGRQAMPEPLF